MFWKSRVIHILLLLRFPLQFPERTLPDVDVHIMCDVREQSRPTDGILGIREYKEQ